MMMENNIALALTLPELIAGLDKLELSYAKKAANDESAQRLIAYTFATVETIIKQIYSEVQFE